MANNQKVTDSVVETETALKIAWEDSSDLSFTSEDEDNFGSRDVADYHYKRIKEFIYQLGDEEIQTDKRKLVEDSNSALVELVNKIYMLEVEIKTKSGETMVMFDSKANKLLKRYDELPREQYTYVAKTDSIAMLCGNYEYDHEGKLTKIKGVPKIVKIGDMEFEDEEKGDIFVDMEFPKSTSLDHDYSSWVVTACLDGTDLFKIFRILFTEQLINETFPVSYSIRLRRTDLLAWKPEEEE